MVGCVGGGGMCGGWGDVWVVMVGVVMLGDGRMGKLLVI